MIAKTAHSGKKRLCHVMSCQRTQRLHSSQPTEIYDRRTPANHPFLQGTGKKHPHATRKLSGGISKPLAGLTSLERFATDEQSFRSFAFEVEAELRPLATPPAGNQALTGPCSIVQPYYAAWGNPVEEAVCNSSRKGMYRPRRSIDYKQINFIWKLGKGIP